MEPTKTKDIAIDLGADKPGVLAKAAEAIAKAGINIDGYFETKGDFHVATRDPAGTRKAAESAGFRVRDERELLVIDAQDRPGFLANVLRKVADQEINVVVSYSLVGNRVAIGADDTAKLETVLSEFSSFAKMTR